MPHYKYDKINNKFTILSSEIKKELPQIVWHILDYCPLKCPYCFSTKSNKQVSVEEIKLYIEKFKRLGIQKVDISGGEPLQYLQLPYLVECMIKEQINFTITSSGSGNENNNRWLVHNANYFSRIIFSLDGYNAETHDKIRGKDGIFNSLMNIIKEIDCKSSGRIRINTVVTNLFLENEYCRRMVNLINEIKPIEWCLIQPHPANQKENFGKYNISNDEFENILENIYKMSSEFNICIIKRYIENYAGYWVLYPDGILKKHTNCKEDLFEINLNTKSMNDILDIVSKNQLWLPIKKGNNEMELENSIKIVNVEKNYLVSDLIQSLEEISRGQLKADQIILKKECDIDKKGEILTEIVLGLAINAIYDILKFVINQYKKRNDYDKSIKIEINNVNISLGDIEKYK